MIKFFRRVFLPVVFVFLAATAFGLTASDIEMLLDLEKMTCAQAAYYVLALALENPPANGEAAFAYARERDWISAKAQSGGPVTMGYLSMLVMKAFDFKGGLMYRITGSPRYAFREMTDRGFISGRTYPGFTVSGEQFLQIAGNVLTYIGGGQ